MFPLGAGYDIINQVWRSELFRPLLLWRVLIMKIVIDIAEDLYEALKRTHMIISGRRNGKTFISNVCNAVANGIPLKNEDLITKAQAIEGESEGNDG